MGRYYNFCVSEAQNGYSVTFHDNIDFEVKTFVATSIEEAKDRIVALMVASKLKPEPKNTATNVLLAQAQQAKPYSGYMSGGGAGIGAKGAIPPPYYNTTSTGTTSTQPAPQTVLGAMKKVIFR